MLNRLAFVKAALGGALAAVFPWVKPRPFEFEEGKTYCMVVTYDGHSAKHWVNGERVLTDAELRVLAEDPFTRAITCETPGGGVGIPVSAAYRLHGDGARDCHEPRPLWVVGLCE